MGPSGGGRPARSKRTAPTTNTKGNAMPTDESLIERVTGLERAHRRLRRVTAALVLGLATTLLLGAAADRTLEGRTLKLTDDQGRVRVLLTTTTGLSFLDAEGRPRAVFGLDADGPGLVLYGESSRAILNLNRDGPALAFTGPRGALRAILALVKGDPGLVFFDAQERERLQLAVRDGGARGELRTADGGAVWRVPGTD